MKKYIFIGPILLFLIWSGVSYFRLIDPFFLPSPIDVIGELARMVWKGGILVDLWGTLTRVGIAFALSVVIGLPLGLILGKAEKVYRSFEFVIDFFRSLPATAVFPLFLLIFGITDASKVAVAAFASTLIIIFNVAYGVMHAKKSRITAARLMGASQLKIFTSIIFWESLPQTFVGLRNALSLSLVVIIVTEMFIGTNHGLGRLIIDYQIVYNIKGMYAAIILAGIIGYILNSLLLNIDKRFVHWGGK